MLIGSETTLLQQALATIGLALVLAGVIAVAFVFLSRRSSATSELQASTIDALAADRDLKTAQINELKSQLEHSDARIASLEEQVSILKEAVTQRAEVAALRDDVESGFKGIHAKLDTALAIKST